MMILRFTTLLLRPPARRAQKSFLRCFSCTPVTDPILCAGKFVTAVLSLRARCGYASYAFCIPLRIVSSRPVIPQPHALPASEPAAPEYGSEEDTSTAQRYRSKHTGSFPDSRAVYCIETALAPCLRHPMHARASRRTCPLYFFFAARITFKINWIIRSNAITNCRTYSTI